MKKKIAIMLGEFLTNFMKVIIHLPGFQVTITNEVYQSIMKELHGSRIEIEKKIRKAYESLHETSNLLFELEDTLKERTEKLNYLRTEYERYNKLTEIEHSKAVPLINHMDTILERGKKTERWFNFFLGLAAGVITTLLGIIFGPYITNVFIK
ncbi:hypothetical protein MHH57_05560 [Paenibacillus sp. FSL H7-0442]|uniref:hypothetical protein n=1 Tax=unclassified Paenibacillus TaxID=185978 RepID=UPI000FB7D247|nr:MULTISPECIES: hypothetical protein [unclassified Paenibacillus]KAF6578393.1 hypothetical protein G9G54_14070 [Paenibacillus sp. EKM212P]MBP1311727.1 putative RNase H-like nuclease (RuvC/YqgF family) [Paenibacillus sp. 1182]